MSAERTILGLIALLLASFSFVWSADASPAAGAASPPLKLSMSDALRLGQEHSLLMQAAAARVRQATADLDTAKARPAPEVSLAHWAGWNTGGLDEDVIISQTLELKAKRHPRIRAAATELDATRADQSATGVDVAYTVQTAYIGALRADVDRRVADDTLQVARAFANAAADRFRAGTIARSEVLRSQLEVAADWQALYSADTNRDNAYAELRSMLGLPDTAALSLTDTLAAKPVSYKLPDLLAFGMQNRPDVKAAELRVSSLGAKINEARAQSKPDFFWEARHYSIYQIGGGDSIRAGVVFPIGDRSQQRAEVRSAQAAAAEQTATAQETRRLARLEIETAFNGLVQAQRQVQAFRGGRLDQAKQLLTMAQYGYQRGASTYLELLDAQHQYRSAQTDYARAEADLRLALAALQHALGGRLP